MITIENIQSFGQDLKFETPDGIRAMKGYKGNTVYFDEGGFKEVFNLMPILYPITALTQIITHKGETFVPLLELANIAFPDEEWLGVDEYGKVYNDEDPKWSDYFHFTEGCFYIKGTVEGQGVPNQLPLFRKCYEWKINLEGIESVDPASMDVNPYE